MISRHPLQRPLDNALKERLNLRGDNPLSLKLIRAAINGADAISRLFTGQPFLALRESEAWMA